MYQDSQIDAASARPADFEMPAPLRRARRSEVDKKRVLNGDDEVMVSLPRAPWAGRDDLE